MLTEVECAVATLLATLFALLLLALGAALPKRKREGRREGLGVCVGRFSVEKGIQWSSTKAFITYM